MDFKSPRYFHSHTDSSTLSSLVDNGEQSLERNKQSFYSKTKSEANNNPFAETFPDPLCKLNLKETSEFVKSFPRREGVNSTQKRLVADQAPPTPGRPVFGFSSSTNGFPRKSFPSKWDDAEKWLVNCSSCHDSPAHTQQSLRTSNNNNINVFKQQMEVFSDKSRVIEEKVSSKVVPNFHNSSVRAFNAVLASPDHVLLLKDKFTEETKATTIHQRLGTSEPTKEAFLLKNPACEAATRDAGTEMTPLGSSTTSRCPTPLKEASPARHNTPLDRSGPLGPCSHSDAAIDIAHLATLQLGIRYDSVASNWSSREEEEEEVSKSLRHFEIDNGCHKSFIANNALTTNIHANANANDSRVAVWEEEEKAKCCSRYQREEAKIQAWVNLQNAKAEAQSRKLEVKIQKMRSNLEEKLMKRMSVVHRKAEEWRESARKQHSDQMQKASQHSNKMLSCNNNKHYHSHFSTYTTASCGCFPCNNNNHYL